MKRSDVFFMAFIIALFLPFFISDGLYHAYSSFNDRHGFIMSFIKFAVLATAGEMLGMRIRSGKYYEKRFGLIPRALVWGFLGTAIKAAFMIFGSGVPVVMGYLGVREPGALLAGPMSAGKVMMAFSISFFLNLIFAPVMMTLHKITDTHIATHKGRTAVLITRIDITSVLSNINWEVHWGFVLKKTIPLFWIPAHTVTFLLPAGYQVLFAALLGIVLGVILAFAARAKSD